MPRQHPCTKPPVPKQTGEHWQCPECGAGWTSTMWTSPIVTESGVDGLTTIKWTRTSWTLPYVD